MPKAGITVRMLTESIDRKTAKLCTENVEVLQVLRVPLCLEIWGVT